MEKQAFAFGHWPSPISAASVAEGAMRFGKVQVSGGAVYWSESRPAEKGRAPVMRWTGEGGVSELLPPQYSARSRVHEYGGGEFLVANDKLYFVNDTDQDVYEAALLEGDNGAAIRRLTRLPSTRFADFAWDARHGRLIAVGESHDPKHQELPKNVLWTIPVRSELGAGNASVLIEGHDFYASPRLSAHGDWIAYLAWDLPSMPWDAAQLCVAEIAGDGSVRNAVSVAGGNGSACFQPEWGPDGTLYFIWDADGFGSLFRWTPGGQPQRITRLDAELSLPLWSLNAASYALLPGDKAYLTFTNKGEAGSGIADLKTGAVAPHANGLSASFNLSSGEEKVALCGMTHDEPLCLIVDTLATKPQGNKTEAIIRRSSTVAIGTDYSPRPERIEIPGKLGPVFGLLYKPASAVADGPAGDNPPLIINLHGGPTSASSSGLRPRTIYFTSRGFAWLDLDYSGSVGYGREYRDRLNGNWGVIDVDDTVSAARFAASAGLCNPNAIFVTGGSAGGYTVLMAIATADVFRGAASYYGICDLVALQKTTHKFEQGYQSTLLGGTLEDAEELYRHRSAISHIAQIKTPLTLFQGAEDHVVPKAQSTEIAIALKEKGIRVEYHEFESEGHGFRRAETIRACLEHELRFYRGVLGGAA